MIIILALLNVSISAFVTFSIRLFIGMKMFSTICRFGLRIVLMLSLIQLG